MKTTNNEGRINLRWLAHRIAGACNDIRPGTTLILLVAIAACATCASAQSLIGSAGNGWQTWNLNQDAFGNFIDLNSNNSPYWDVPFLTFNAGGYGGNLANKSVGWCLTSTGDCQGVGSALFAPGPLPFWAGPYDAATDTGGALDPKVYFRSTSYGYSGQSYKATLYLNTATNTFEINEFGWFETNASGSVKGTRHVLFHGSGNPPGSATPDPVGKTVTFQPTQYFGFYYQDVSDPQTFTPYAGCIAYTIFAFNDSDCTAASGQGDHVFAVFLQPNTDPTYWVAGQDPSACTEDGDCNLTLVKVRPARDE